MIHWRLIIFSVESAAVKQCHKTFLTFSLSCQDAIISTVVPESLMSLRASLSEKEDISFGGFSDAFSNPRKGTLLQYTTSSDSSGLSLEQTWEGQRQTEMEIGRLSKMFTLTASQT